MELTIDNIADICSHGLAKQIELRQKYNLLPFRGAIRQYAPENIFTNAQIMIEIFMEDTENAFDKLKLLLFHTTDPEIRKVLFKLITLQGTVGAFIMVLIMHMLNIVEKTAIDKRSRFYSFLLHIIDHIFSKIPEVDLLFNESQIRDITPVEVEYLKTNFTPFFNLFTN